MSALHGKERAGLCVTLRAPPVPGQFQEWRTRRYLFDGIALRRIIHVPADPALQTAIVTQPGLLLAGLRAGHATSDQYGSRISFRRSAESTRSSGAALTTLGT